MARKGQRGKGSRRKRRPKKLSVKLRGGGTEELTSAHQQLVERYATQPEGLHILGVNAYQEGRLAAAQDFFARAARVNPGAPEYQNSLGNAFHANGEFTPAIAAYERAISLKPDYAQAYHNLGIVLKRQGHFEQAVSHFERSLELDHHNASARRNLNLMGGAAADDAQLEQARRELERPGLSEDEQMHLNFALGKILDDRGEYRCAFEHYERANALRRRSVEYDEARYSQLVAGIVATFSAQFISVSGLRGNPSDKPVFILGMPRSGTTLVEHILSSHPKVFGAGELEKLGQLAQQMPARIKTLKSFPECMADLGQGPASAIAKDYLAHLDGHSREASRVTDKAPNNFLYIGLIRLLFPRAHIVHCTRHRLDTCLSNFFQYYHKGNPFSYDLGELARYYRHYERLMAHWHTQCAGDILDVHYEEMVRDQEAVSRRIVDFVGLDWDDACLTFHKNTRAVSTASSWQVRQPIYTTSVDRAKHYEEFLAPLLDAFQRDDA